MYSPTCTFSAFLLLPELVGRVVAVLVQTTLALEPASPLGGLTEAHKLSGVFIPARAFDRTPSFFTR